MTETAQRSAPRQLSADAIIINGSLVFDTVVGRSRFCESCPRFRIAVHMTAMTLLVCDVAFTRTDADPWPNGTAARVVPGEVDLDGEE